MNFDQATFELPKNLFLQIQFLGSRLDNQIGFGTLVQARCSVKLLQRAVAVVFG